MRYTTLVIRFARMLLVTAICLPAQPPAGAPAPSGAKPQPQVFRRPPDFPQRPPADPAVVARGKQLYSVHCTFCHGADARGGSGGPNLIRTAVVLNDQNGEGILPVLREGREGMPKFDMTPAQAADLAAFLHSFRVGGYDISRNPPPSIVVGDAKAGQAYFQKVCGGCHSATGDLKGIATKIDDPKRLQQTWLMPGGGGGRRFGPPVAGLSPPKPIRVTVAVAGGKKVEGRLERIDDFFVSMIDSEGVPRTFTRNGDTPKVELHDPYKAHRDLIPTYKDSDIHNVTAFLVTLQ